MTRRIPSRNSRTRKLSFDLLEDRVVPSAALEQMALAAAVAPPPALQVVLVSDAVAQADRVATAAVPGALAFTYDSQATDAAGLAALLESASAAHGGARIGRLALVAHGHAGHVGIGAGASWNLDTVGQDGAAWQQLRSLLAEDARLDLYACNVAAGAAGRAFVDALAVRTGAQVFASDDRVGSGKAGDYQWEYVAGQGQPTGELLSVSTLEGIAGLALDDRFEENDSREEVDTYEEGAKNSPNLGLLTETTTLLDLAMEDDADWFSFRTAGVGTSQSFVRISFSPEDGDLDLCVWRLDATLVDCSAFGGTDSELVRLSGERTGTYYVHIYRAGVPVTNNYRLQMAVPLESPDDRFEDNDTPEEVDSQPEGEPDSPNLGELTAITPLLDQVMDDRGDWFKFRTAGVSTDDHYVRISFAPLDGDLDLCVWRSDFTLVDCSPFGGTDSELVRLSGERTGTYYVRVYPSDERKGIARYDLQIAPPVAGSDDAFEDNDTPEEVDSQPEGEPDSPNLGLLTTSTQILNLVMDDRSDWFKFRSAGPGTDQHFVRISLAPLDGDLDLCVWRSDFTLVDCSAFGGTDSELVRLTDLPAGAYYVRVYPSDSRKGIASYHLQIVPPSGELPSPPPDRLPELAGTGEMVPAFPAAPQPPIRGTTEMTLPTPAVTREPAAVALPRSQAVTPDSVSWLLALLTSPFDKRALDAVLASGSW